MGLHESPLASEHAALGAKMADFAGWSMPLEYAGTVGEHEAVRCGVGAFDVSHLGTVHVRGERAIEVIAATFTNDPSVLVDGRSQYTLCPNEAGGIVDDCIVYRLAADDWLVIPNAANTPAVVSRLASAAADRSVEVDDRSHDWAVIAVQGPESFAVAQQAVGVDPSPMPFQAVVALDGRDGWCCRTGYTGERGIELVVAAAEAPSVWRALADAGAAPCGLGARDTLRLEMGYPLHGNDMSVDTNPYEARMGWAVKLDRDPFTGQEALRLAKQAGPSRRLLGLVGEGRRPLRAGMEVFVDDRLVGSLTSGGFSVTRQVGIGLGYLDDPIAAGDRVEVDVRGKRLAVEVVRPPFVDADPHA